MDFVSILNSKNTFIIAEIGQNHQGNLAMAKQLIKTAKECGADCAKFQKSNLEEKFNNKALKRAYNSPNSFGKTYGEHKQFLEFNEEEFQKLQMYANKIGILFTASAMDLKSLDFLININVPFIKIGSGDANNFVLLEKAAQTGIFLIVSTGMQSLETVRKIYQLISKYHKKFIVLHCVSAYPTPVSEINLNVIKLYQKEFPDIDIGYSGHELGIHISLATVAMGAKVIERHITLDKNQKGSDHQCSLDPTEFTQLVNNIKSIETAMGQSIKCLQTCEKPCYEKLGKTLVYTKELPKGHILTNDDLNVKVAEPKGIDGALLNNVIGKTLVVNVENDESVLLENLE